MPTASLVAKVNGDASVMRFAGRIEYAEAIDRLDALVLELELHRQHDPGPVVKLVQPGAPFTVQLYDGTTLAGEGTGDVVEITHERTRRGHRVTALGLGTLHRLRGSQPAKVWDVSHTDIVSQIAQRHGLKAVSDGISTTPGYELQGDEGDALFLHKLAREHNYHVRVVGKELHFKRNQATGTAVECTWGDDIVELRLRSSLAGLATKVTVLGWDPEQDAVVTGEASPTDLKKISGGEAGASVANAKFGASAVTLNQAGYVAASNAKERATAELQERAERYVQGRAVLFGTPKARAGLPLKIVGAGWPFAATFLAREVRHVLEADAGYRTLIDFVSDSLPAVPT